MREVAFPNSALHPQVSFCFSFLGLIVGTPRGQFFHLGQRPCPSAKSEPKNEYLDDDSYYMVSAFLRSALGREPLPFSHISSGEFCKIPP